MVLLALCLSSLAHSAELVTFQQFDSATLPGGGWGFGSGDGGTVTISTDTTKNYAGSAGSIRATYPARDAGGGGYVWGGYDVLPLATRDVYVEFWAKMPTSPKQGLKFLKIFGQRLQPTNYANTTFGLDYTGVDFGSMYCVSFGDGTGSENDTANIILFDGTSRNLVGRSFGTASIQTPQNTLWASSNWGDTWHHFRIHVKFNSGTSAANEIADGAYYVEIDGDVYVDASNLLNRHYSNGPIESIALFGWTQTNTAPFEIWYDDVRISTGGFITGGGASNQAPVATAQSVSTSENTAENITLAASDADGDALTYNIVSNPSHGVLSGSGANRTYTPTSGYVGADSFTFRANDGTANSNLATVSITVTASGMELNLNFEQGTDGQPADGPSGFSGAHAKTFYSSDIANSGSKSSKVEFVAGTDAWGTSGGAVDFPHHLSNGQELWCRGYFYFKAPWSWTCSPVVKIFRGAHISNASGNNVGYLSVFSDTTGEILLSNEAGGAQTSTGVSFDIGRWQCIEMYTKLSTTDPVFRIWKDGVLIAENTTHKTLGSSTDYADFAYIFTYWNGNVPQNQDAYVDDFIWTTNVPDQVDDAGNPMIGLIENGEANVAPVVASTIPNQSATVGNVFSYTVSAGTFTDANGDVLTWSASGLPAGLTFTAATRVISGTPTTVESSTVTVLVDDGHGHSASTTFTISVTGGVSPNQSPVAIAQNISTLQNTAKDFTLSATDADGDALIYAIVANPAHGTLSGSGANRTYTPTAGYVGADSFTFRVNDGTVNSNVATVSINVLSTTAGRFLRLQASNANGAIDFEAEVDGIHSASSVDGTAAAFDGLRVDVDHEVKIVEQVVSTN